MKRLALVALVFVIAFGIVGASTVNSQVSPVGPTPTPTTTPFPTPTPLPPTSYQGEGWSVSWREGYSYSPYANYLPCVVLVGDDTLRACFFSRSTDSHTTAAESLMEFIHGDEFRNGYDYPYYYTGVDYVQYDQNGNLQQEMGDDRAWVLVSKVSDSPVSLIYVEVRRISKKSMLFISISFLLDNGVIPEEEIDAINELIGNISIDAPATPVPMPTEVLTSSNATPVPVPTEPAASSNGTFRDSVAASDANSLNDSNFGWSISWDDSFSRIMYPHQTTELSLVASTDTFTLQVEFLPIDASFPLVADGTISLDDPVSCLKAQSQIWRGSGYTPLADSHSSFYANVLQDSDTRAGELYVDSAGSGIVKYVDCRAIMPGVSTLVVMASITTHGSGGLAGGLAWLSELLKNIVVGGE